VAKRREVQVMHVRERSPIGARSQNGQQVDRFNPPARRSVDYLSARPIQVDLRGRQVKPAQLGRTFGVIDLRIMRDNQGNESGAGGDCRRPGLGQVLLRERVTHLHPILARFVAEREGEPLVQTQGGWTIVAVAYEKPGVAGTRIQSRILLEPRTRGVRQSTWHVVGR
jgi:hypothetical protein